MRWWICAALLALLVPGTGETNGRPPVTNGIYLRPESPSSLYVRSTFGLLVSHDDGCTFRWVCESAIGYGGEFDPKYAIAGDGTIFATTFEGLRVSRDGGCSWETATASLPADDPGRIDDKWIDAIDISPTGEVWVATAETGQTNDVYRSKDNGVTFTPANIGSDAIRMTAWWKSLRVARSEPSRIYVTGYRVAPTTQAFLFRTSDGGATWSEVPLAKTIQFGSTPIIHVAAVDPTNPDHLLLTSLGANPPEGDRVYRSTDGGATFTEVVATTDPVTGVVFRGAGTVLVATVAGGTFESAAGGAPPYAPLGQAQPNAPDLVPPRLGCLAEKPDGELVGCGANWQPDYMAVGRATSPLGWQKLFRFVELAGTLECPAGTTTQLECDPQWPALAQQFGVSGPPAVCGGAIDLPPAVDGPPLKTDPGGCCSAGTSATSSIISALGAVSVILLRRRRRR